MKMVTQKAVEESISNLPASMSKGQRALEKLSIYRAARLDIPESVLKEIDECYRHFQNGKPAKAFHPAIERNKGAPLTLGEAFGVPDKKGGEMVAISRKRLAIAEPMLVALFSGQAGKKLARTKEGYEKAASQLGLSAKAVEAWVSKTISVRRKATKRPVAE